MKASNQVGLLRLLGADPIRTRMQQGRLFVSTVQRDLGNMEELRILIRTTGEQRVHIQFTLSFAAVGSMEVFEDAMVGDTGTPIPVINRNRVLAAEVLPQTLVFIDPVFSTFGLNLSSTYVRGALSFGQRGSFVIKPSTDYIVMLRNESTNKQLMSIELDIYEPEPGVLDV